MATLTRNGVKELLRGGNDEVDIRVQLFVSERDFDCCFLKLSRLGSQVQCTRFALLISNASGPGPYDESRLALRLLIAYNHAPERLSSPLDPTKGWPWNRSFASLKTKNTS